LATAYSHRTLSEMPESISLNRRTLRPTSRLKKSNDFVKRAPVI
jgi:hypothetical protein